MPLFRALAVLHASAHWDDAGLELGETHEFDSGRPHCTHKCNHFLSRLHKKAFVSVECMQEHQQILTYSVSDGAAKIRRRGWLISDGIPRVDKFGICMNDLDMFFPIRDSSCVSDHLSHRQSHRIENVRVEEQDVQGKSFGSILTIQTQGIICIACLHSPLPRQCRKSAEKRRYLYKQGMRKKT